MTKTIEAVQHQKGAKASILCMTPALDTASTTRDSERAAFKQMASKSQQAGHAQEDYASPREGKPISP